LARKQRLDSVEQVRVARRAQMITQSKLVIDRAAIHQSPVGIHEHHFGGARSPESHGQRSPRIVHIGRNQVVLNMLRFFKKLLK
jgi:hypothetical protein